MKHRVRKATPSEVAIEILDDKGNAIAYIDVEEKIDFAVEGKMDFAVIIKVQAVEERVQVKVEK